MSVTFVPADEEILLVEETLAWSSSVGHLRYIKALVIDESGPGVEIRVMSDGEVVSRPLEEGIDHYRNSPLWKEVVDG